MKQVYGVYTKDCDRVNHYGPFGLCRTKVCWITARPLGETIPHGGLRLAGIIKVEEGSNKSEFEIFGEDDYTTLRDHFALLAFQRTFDSALKVSLGKVPVMKAFTPFFWEGLDLNGDGIYYGFAYQESDAAQVVYERYSGRAALRTVEYSPGHWAWPALGKIQKVDVKT
jgi:hypothetical protein